MTFPPRTAAVAGLLALLCAAAAAQRGDRAGEEQPPLPAGIDVPPAPVLSPQQALAAFRLQPGLRIELVAAEPLVEDPVVAVFDADGRLWVAEMRGYMPDVDGTGEDAPVGAIAVLEDTDGDGAMDRRTVFLDRLVLPRAVLPVPGGALFVEPPDLWFGRDLDGDLRCDERVRVAGGFEAGISNPEHAGNGLLWGLDNWIHLANHPFRYRWNGAGFERAASFGGGQWGLGMDDLGRLWFDYNSDWLRMDRYPGHYGVRHPHQGPAPGLNLQVVRDQSVWPIRVTAGINRGYQPGMLRDGRLARTTACCGPAIYRGTALPGMAGDAFVCEPAANLVRRFVLTEAPGGAPTGANPYREDEFLAAADERFRPVNLSNGPDGALYVVDMYRGVIQHRNFVTTWLRRQIEQRGLERPTGLGRIWRVVADGAAPVRPGRLTAQPTAALVQRLASPQGAVRDLCQQTLVARGDPAAAVPLRALARSGADAIPRLHALWTLAGMAALDRVDVLRALQDDDARVRGAGVRLAEARLRAGADAGLRSLLEHLARHEAAAEVAVQLALTLGEVAAPWALACLADLALRRPDDALLRGAAVSGLHRRELDLLRVLGDRGAGAPHGWLRELARLAVQEPDVDARLLLLDFIAARMDPAAQLALLQGVVAALPKGPRRAAFLQFPVTPPALAAMQRTGDPQVVPLVQEILGAVALVQAEDDASGAAADGPRRAAGARVYAAHCAACHQPDGRGMPGLAPPLRDSEWVLGPADVPIRIVLHGLSGPVQVAGEEWDLEMQPLGHLADGEVAAVLSYVRGSWGHRAPPVSAAEVAAVRTAHAARKGQWSAQELRLR